MKIYNEFDKKQKKIEEEKMNFEEERLKKINRVQAKRLEVLMKKKNVKYNQETNNVENKALQIDMNLGLKKENNIFKSKTSLTCRSVNRRTFSKF